MKIHTLNYEAYAIDYLEGNMTAEERSAFEEFLSEHPQVNEELKQMQLFYAVPNEEVVYTGKEDLMKATPAKASVFKLPSWAIAASWALVISSMLVWLWTNPNSQNMPLANEVASIEEEVKTQSYVEVVKVDVTRTSESKNVELKQSVHKQPTVASPVIEQDVMLSEQETPSTDLNAVAQTDIQVIHRLPASDNLNELEVIAQTPTTFYYRPIKKLNLQPIDQESQIQPELEHKIALMTPLKRVMKPESYQKINDFNLMEDVIKEIDGREVADAFTPEFLKNNLK